MFLSPCLLRRAFYQVRPKRDRWWKIQRLKDEARHYWYRTMRVRIGLMYIHVRRSLLFQTQARLVRPYVRGKLRACRVEAAGNELDVSRHRLQKGLLMSGVKLNTHMLSTLSMYEPRTFEKLTELSERVQIEKIYSKHIKLPDRCFTKLVKS